MIKRADDRLGSVSSQGVNKSLTDQDRRRLDEGVMICKGILRRFGACDEDMFLGTAIAGHSGGMLPLTEEEASSFHSAQLPENLYVADASLLPKSLGNPLILTIIAMAKWYSPLCIAGWALAWLVGSRTHAKHLAEPGFSYSMEHDHDRMGPVLNNEGRVLNHLLARRFTTKVVGRRYQKLRKAPLV